MSKSSLTDNIHWEKYKFKVQMLIERPKNCGSISEEEAKNLNGELFVYDYGNPSAGRMLRLYWVIESTGNRVVSCRYQFFWSTCASCNFRYGRTAVQKQNPRRYQQHETPLS